MWWDGDMRKERNRTLLGWGIASALFQTGRANTKPKVWPPEPMSRRARHQRDRTTAEIFEGISQRHDQSGLGTGPFGRMNLWRSIEFWRRRR